MAVDSLLKINAMISQITFGYALVDRPEPGYYMHFIFSTHQEECPGDGYIWLDDETTMTYPLEESGGAQPNPVGPCNKFLYVFQRKQGVSVGENTVSMIRRRYQLVIKGQPLQVQLMHYLAAEESVRHIPVNTSIYKLPARRFNFPRPSAQPLPPPPTNQRLVYSATGIRPKQRPFDGPLRKPLPTDPSYSAVDDGPNINVTYRDVATLRFNRNHEWMESIFAPTSQPPSLPTNLVFDSLKKKLEKLKNEDVEMSKDIESSLKNINLAIKQLDHIKSMESLQEHIKTALGGSLQPYQAVTQVDLNPLTKDI
ncbi:hypothetical protein HMI55_000526 [Coelomomyces lativittatus]|nr:hypothetical protein HMI55_000526 [Coelomomyces lativittatus]